MRRFVLLSFEILGLAALGIVVLMFLAGSMSGEGDRWGVPMFLTLLGGFGIVVLTIYGAARIFGVLREEKLE